MNKLTLFLMTAAAAVACRSVSDKTFRVNSQEQKHLRR